MVGVRHTYTTIVGGEDSIKLWTRGTSSKPPPTQEKTLEELTTNTRVASSFLWCSIRSSRHPGPGWGGGQLVLSWTVGLCSVFFFWRGNLVVSVSPVFPPPVPFRPSSHVSLSLSLSKTVFLSPMPRLSIPSQFTQGSKLSPNKRQACNFANSGTKNCTPRQIKAL